MADFFTWSLTPRQRRIERDFFQLFYSAGQLAFPWEAVFSVTFTYPVPRSMRPLAIPSTRCSSACCCSTFAMGTPLREMRGVCTSLLESSTRAPPRYRARIFKLLWSPRIDSTRNQFSRQAVCVAWRASTTLPYSYSVPSPHRFLNNSGTEVQNLIESIPETCIERKNIRKVKDISSLFNQF